MNEGVDWGTVAGGQAETDVELHHWLDGGNSEREDAAIALDRCGLNPPHRAALATGQFEVGDPYVLVQR